MRSIHKAGLLLAGAAACYLAVIAARDAQDTTPLLSRPRYVRQYLVTR